MKIKILISLIVIIVLASFGIIYLNKVFFPIKVKEILTKSMESALNRKVKFDTIKFTPLKGVVLTGLEISEKPSLKNPKVFLKVKQVSFGVLYLPSLKEKKIIIPRINIDSPEVSIIRTDKNSFNFSDLIAAKTTNQKSKISFAVYGIAVNNAKIKFLDQTQNPEFSCQLDNLNLRLGLSLPTSVRFNASANLQGSKLDISGGYNIQNNELKATLAAGNINVADYKIYYQSLAGFLKSAFVTDLKLDIFLKNQTLDADGNINLKNLAVKKDDFDFSGNVNLSGNIKYNLKSNKADYHIKTQIKETCQLKGLPFVGAATILKADIKTDNSSVKIDSLEAESNSMPVKLSGEVENFQDPNIDLHIISDLQLNKLNEILLKAFKITDFKPSGNASLDLKLTGPVKQLNYSGNTKITGADLELPDLGKIADINGSINFSNKDISWQNLTFKYRESSLSTDAVIKDFRQPSIDLKIKSDVINLSALINSTANSMKISRLTGKVYESSLDVKGSIDITEKENPVADLTADIKLNIEDIKNYKPYATIIENSKLSGILDISSIIKGSVKNWRSCSILIDAKSPSINISGLKTGPLSLNYKQENTVLKNCALNLKPYKGNIDASILANIESDDIPYSIKLNASSIDLSELKADTPLKDKNLSGLMALNFDLAGNIKDITNPQGKANLQIKFKNTISSKTLLRIFSSPKILPPYLIIITFL